MGKVNVFYKKEDGKHEFDLNLRKKTVGNGRNSYKASRTSTSLNAKFLKPHLLLQTVLKTLGNCGNLFINTQSGLKKARKAPGVQKEEEIEL